MSSGFGGSFAPIAEIGLGALAEREALGIAAMRVRIGDAGWQIAGMDDPPWGAFVGPKEDGEEFRFFRHWQPFLNHSNINAILRIPSAVF